MEKVRKKLEYESKPSNSDETIIAKKAFYEATKMHLQIFVVILIQSMSVRL
tara:strand:+ start:130 stop:282 length:153 start_codon:yes stop_codon:yes gene_type:complete